jgi:hypothetical protein
MACHSGGAESSSIQKGHGELSKAKKLIDGGIIIKHTISKITFGHVFNGNRLFSEKGMRRRGPGSRDRVSAIKRTGKTRSVSILRGRRNNGGVRGA